jgi:hypothetical protein
MSLQLPRAYGLRGTCVDAPLDASPVGLEGNLPFLILVAAICPIAAATRPAIARPRRPGTGLRPPGTHARTPTIPRTLPPKSSRTR